MTLNVLYTHLAGVVDDVIRADRIRVRDVANGYRLAPADLQFALACAGSRISWTTSSGSSHVPHKSDVGVRGRAHARIRHRQQHCRLQRTIHGLEPDLPLYDVQSMTNALDSGRGRFLVRAAALFAGVLALLALTFTVAGVYGMVSYLTSERTHEIGVRIALGVTSVNIAQLVAKEAVTLTIVAPRSALSPRTRTRSCYDGCCLA